MHPGEAVHPPEYAKIDHIFGVNQGAQEHFRDGVTAQELVPALVKAARLEEMEFFRAKSVWEKRPMQEARQRTGKAPITV